MKILLQGYYGFGNLGDDILMITTYKYLKNNFRDCEIKIFSNAPNTANNYISKLIGEEVEVVNYSYQGHFNLIIHGGGGIHYDFNRASRFYAIINSLIRLIGYQYYLQIYHLYKKLKGKEHITTDLRLGLGIGVGTFTRSSKKFHTNITILADYDYLFVRDLQSLSNAKRYLPMDNVFLARDLAFMKDYWHEASLKKLEKKGENVGFVLRKWEEDEEHLDSLRELKLNLNKRGIKVTYFLLQKEHDLPIVNKLAHDAGIKFWEPEKQNLEDYLSLISNQDLILTSRYHGAIVAAALGIPAFALAIEPKLASLPACLPSVQLIDLPIDTSSLEENILDKLADIQIHSQVISDEYDTNMLAIRKSLSTATQLINHDA
jgi:polysaccharide pyruvyl transferase WcaK-like protein